MIWKTGFVLLVLFAMETSAVGQEWARKMFETTDHDFGSVAQNAKIEHRFVVTNRYIEDVHITHVRSSCGCTSVSIPNPILKTYQKGVILAKFNTDKFLGDRHATITVTLDKPFPATVRLNVKGQVRSNLVLEPGGADVGNIDQGTPVTRTISVTRTGWAQWKILEVRSANPHLSGKVLDIHSDGYRVRATLEVLLDADAPVGYVRDQLMLVTNDPGGVGVPVQVDGRVMPSVSVSPESLFLGVLRCGQSVTKQVVVRAKEPFRITAVTSDERDGLKLDVQAPEEAQPIHVVPLTFIAGDEPGKIEQTVHFETETSDAELSTQAVVEP